MGIEHNKFHHYTLNEDADPDRPDRNNQNVRGLPLPRVVKYAVVVFAACTWKWFYYASNTLKLLQKDQPDDIHEPIFLSTVFRFSLMGDRWYKRFMLDFIFRGMALPFLLQYVAYPILVGLLHGASGTAMFCRCAVLNIAGAELLANIQQFSTIVTNHAGSDLWTFKDSCKTDTPEFYLRAVLASTAYQNGTDIVDYLHGYLNYQAEHHCFPALSPLHYQRLHPHFMAICAEHGVPYIEEPVWTRVRKTVDVIVGKSNMPQLSG